MHGSQTEGAEAGRGIKQLRDITTWDPESKAQSSHFWGADAYTDISHPGTEMPESSKNAHLAIQAHRS